MLMTMFLACSAPHQGPQSAVDTDSDQVSEAWVPGTNVPGWEDYTCPTEERGSNVIDLSFPSPYPVVGQFSEVPGWAGPQQLVMEFRDCVSFDCVDSASDTASHPYLDVALSTYADPGVERGMGEFGPDDAGDRTVTVTAGQTLFGMLSNTDGDLTEANVSATACLSRVRPDSLVGVVEMRGDPAAFGLDDEHYDEVVFRVHLDVVFADHTGYDNDEDAVEADAPEGFQYAYYDYSTSYEDAWPWDEISDGQIREDVYSRYTPYNAP